jgi:CRISPR/Cas system-associated exonuclease Cas4 (RecB family)
MELRENHRKVNRIRYKVRIDGGTIGRVRGALWQGKEVESEEDMSISIVMRRSMEKSPLHRTLHGNSAHCSCVVEDPLA